MPELCALVSVGKMLCGSLNLSFFPFQGKLYPSLSSFHGAEGGAFSSKKNPGRTLGLHLTIPCQSGLLVHLSYKPVLLHDFSRDDISNNLLALNTFIYSGWLTNLVHQEVAKQKLLQRRVNLFWVQSCFFKLLSGSGPWSVLIAFVFCAFATALIKGAFDFFFVFVDLTCLNFFFF